MVEIGLRSWKRLLWSAGALFAAGLACVVCAAFFMPLDPAAVKHPVRSADKARAQADPATKKLPPLESYVAACQRDLRKPLFDGPRPADPGKPKKKLPLTLVGTAIDPGFTYGIFKDSRGATLLGRVGQVIEGAEVMSVAESTATVKFEGEVVTLTVAGKEKKP